MKVKRFFLIGALVMALFAIALLTDLPSWNKYRNGDVKDFNTAAAGELKDGDLVKGKIYVTYGVAVEREETKKHFGITTSKSTTMKYYCVEMENGKRILYGTSKNDEYGILDDYARKLEALYDKYDKDPDSVSDSDVPSMELPFEAKVHKLTGELNNVFADWYGEGYSSDCEDVYLTKANFDGFQTTVFIGFGLAAGAVILLVLFIVFTIKGKKGAQYGY